MWLRLFIGIICLIVALLLLPRFQSDFAQDYAAARGWWAGQDTNGRTADLLSECCAGIAPLYGGMQTAHPPFATLLALPLARLPWPLARTAWLIASWLAIVGAWQILRVSPWLCATTASFWIIALGLGTHEPLMFLLLALAFQLDSHARRPAAALIGLCAAIKVYPAVLIVGLWVSGRRQMALVAASVGAAILILCELVLGFGVTLGWLRFVPINTLYYVDEIGNDSLVRLVRAIIPGAPPAPIALAALLLLFVPLVPRIRSGAWMQPLIPVMLLASPLSWRHYMGLVALDNVRPFEQACLALAGLAALLVGMNLLPPDNMAPIVQGPLLLVLMLMWYRQARLGKPPTPAPNLALPAET
ncbi:MAG TPA: glycosyltransferase family 87 protein [Roseiflexaceae bacterium]|nr:glycosyltransferase family 87 protein [Roseiflexaceae bacterium]